MTPGLSSHFKIGLLVIVAVVALAATAIGLGIRSRKPTVTYHTYFDESVQGLEIGARVRYRGVAIGNVSKIAIAPDARHVDVAMAIDRAEAEKLRLARFAPQLRARMGTLGITGVKYVDIDFPGPGAAPPPTLTFAPGPYYIPSQRSLFGGLEHDLDVMGRELPKAVASLNQTLGNLDAVLVELRDQRVLARMAEAVDDVRHLIRHLDRETISRLDGVLDQIGGPKGLVASAHRATDALGDFGRGASRSAGDFDQTIRDLGDAARAVRNLAREIERQPDILVKGRGRR